MSCACTVASLATTRKTVDKSGGQEAKVDQKQVRKVTNMLMDGVGVVSMSMGCGKRQTGRQELVQDCGREQTIGHHGKNQWGGLRSTAVEDAAARTMEGVKSRKRAKVTGAEGVRRHANRCQHRNPRGHPARAVRRVR